MKKIFAGWLMTICAAAVFSTALAPSASADGHEIKYRKAVMKAVGGAMSGLAAVVKQQAPAEHAVPLARVMNDLAAVVPDVFPASSDFGDTTALPAIWEKPGEFKAAVDAFTAAAAALPAAAAAGGDAYRAAFGALGKSCKGCQTNFREKKS